MMLKVLKYPNPFLRKVAEPVKEYTAELLQLMEDMYDTMMVLGGIGLAAPQVGKSIRMIVLLTPDLGNLIDQQFPFCVMINPEVISTEGSELDTEFCLSVPGKGKKVRRSKTIQVKYLDPFGKEIVVKLSDLKARCVLHEIDHLNGVLLVDK
jgi:peptide deformylase